jgi:biotin carboxylase
MTGARPHRLVISYEYGSQSLFALNEAALDLCEIVWLADLSTPEMAQMGRLMSRMGRVVDRVGLSDRQVIEAVAATGPTGVLSLSDPAIVLLAEAALTLGLDFHPPEVAQRLVDKLVQRRALRAAGIPTPDFYDIPAGPEQADLELPADGIDFPAVLKPRQGSGSRNTYLVHDQAELTRLLSGSGPRQLEPGGMILESYLPGPERPVSRFDPIVSVESFVRGGDVRHYAVTGRLPFAEPFRETGSVLPSDLSPELAEEASAITSAAITALGVHHGCLHTELKFTPDGPRIIEVNGRLGGGIPQLVALATEGTSVLRVAMELALGVPAAIHTPIRYTRIGWYRTLPPPVSADRVDTIAGLETLRSVPGADQVTINRNAGETVDWRRGLQEFVYQVYGSGRDYDEVEAQCAMVDRAVTVTYDEGSSQDLRRRKVRSSP